MQYVILAIFVIVLIVVVLLFFYISSTLQARRVKPSFRVLNSKEASEQLNKYVYEHQRYRSQFSVLMVPMKGASSELIVELAKYVRDRVRLVDEVGLWGDGLVFIMPHTPLKGASAMGSRIKIELFEQLEKMGAGAVAGKLTLQILNFPRDRGEIEKLASPSAE